MDRMETGDGSTFALSYSGRYSLERSVRAARQAGFLDADPAGGTLAGVELVLLLDGSWSPVVVRLAHRDREVVVRPVANPAQAPLDLLGQQLRRMLSLDGDGAAFERITELDPVLRAAHDAQPGLRPWLHASPFEALARAITMHRLFRGQVRVVTERLRREHGAAVQVGERVVHAFPGPEALASLPELRGLSDRKVEQLRLLGRAALDGRLDADLLQRLPPDEAMRRLQQVDGVGPFSAELVVIRGVGDPDRFPTTERSLHRIMAEAYRLGPEPTAAELERIAARWSPFRSWAGLLLRHGAEHGPSVQ